MCLFRASRRAGAEGGHHLEVYYIWVFITGGVQWEGGAVDGGSII